ncbi:MAG: hypothetical protein FWE20_00385 [Defluviitaleaceae bacterium]|nr:hypothetical protein [Defluviitaleaceae bacterium]
MSSFGTMSVAVSGMNAARTGLNVVGHNIGNSTAPGYSRQRVLQHNFSYINGTGASRANLTSLRGGTNMMQRGLGTDVSSIIQVRDMFIDISYRREIGRLGFHTPMADTGLEIELLLAELHGAMPGQLLFDDLRDVLNELSVNQPAIEVRNNFISTAVTFITKMNSIHSHLRMYQQNLNAQVHSAVTRINQLLEQVAQLNRVIVGEEGHSRQEDRMFLGDNANDLRDRRNLALDELATLLNITFREDARGNIEIRSGNSVLLSGGSEINRIGLKQAAPGSNLVMPVITNSREILPYSTPSSHYRQLFNLNEIISADNGNDSGRLLGLLMARGLSTEDSYSPERLAHVTAGITTQLNAAYTALSGAGGVTAAATAALNALLAMAPDDPNLTQAQANLARALQNDANSFVGGGGTLPAAFTDAMSEHSALVSQRDRINFNINQAMIPRTMMKLDTLFRHAVELINDAISPRVWNSGTGEWEHDVDNTPFNNRPYPDNVRNFYAVFVRNYSNGTYRDRLDVEDPHDWLNAGSLYTLGNVTVNPVFLSTDGLADLALSLDPNAPSDTTLVNQLLEDWADATVVFPGFENSPMTISAAYGHMVTVNADTTSEATGFVREQTTLVSFIDNKRQSIKGVSMDEELSLMLIFQHSYNANARMVNMLDSMLDTIINGLRPR